jgi:hypothetical protein
MTKFGKLRLKHEISLSAGSSKKVEWVCDCGRETLKSYNSVVNGHTKTCGRCNTVSADFFKTTKFGKLKLRDPRDLKPGSSKKVEWVCDCGNTTMATVNNVVKGHTKTCGKCDVVTAEFLKEAKFGSLVIETPENFKPSSAKKVGWVCDCGNVQKIVFNAVYGGHTKTCGRCNVLPLEFFKEKKFGKLRMKNPQSVKPGSDQKIEWVCDCGNTALIAVKCVVGGVSKSCGKCNVITASRFSTLKFGKLQMKFPQDAKPGSGKKVWWMCDCGNEVMTTINRVTRGATTTCGKCVDNTRTKFEKFRTKILIEGLPKYPIHKNDNLVAWFGPQQDIISGGVSVEATCPACGSLHKTRFSDIVRGWGLTCGCCTNRVSMAQRNLCQFIENLGVSAVMEHDVEGLKYDIFVPSHNLLIEYNGLRWHSFKESKAKDVKKYEHATRLGFEFMSVFEDEWTHRRKIIEKLFENRLGMLRTKSVRPNRCQFSSVNCKDADAFYERCHYIGKSKSKVNYGAFHSGNMLACMSIKHPTRQSKHEWELTRMASDPEFRIHGVWNKLLAVFVDEHRPKTIVSFSDNRLFTGKVYGKLGFVLDGHILPSYYWVKGQNRFHKSALRKTQEERLTGKTETELREAQGYRKIWDLGKKRWVMSFLGCES